MRLRPGECLRLDAAAGQRIQCCAGRVWITQENDVRDIFLDAGAGFTFRTDGLALVTAEEGMRGEWLEDTGIAVVALISHRDTPEATATFPARGT